MRDWVKFRERNEALDLEVYALAAVYIGGQAFVRGLGERAARFARPGVEATVPAPDKSQPLRRPRGWIPRRIGWIDSWRC